ncbi:hypothetical protein [Chryseobacterium sp. POE27]|uniref:hypothetical protein n=1 Tax=Chryseobacterium sp. POE27 TaxID=3138177 RepID=UPI0032192E98
MKKIVNLFIFLIGNIFISQIYAKCPTNDISINIAGIVFDSKTLLPLQDVNIYDEKGEHIAKTDTKGYFKGKLKGDRSNNSLKFKIRLEKKGYLKFTQTENWADSQKEQININYYFGMTKTNEPSEAESFSQFFLSRDNSFEAISNGLNKVLEKIKFRNTINNLRKENQNSFFELDHSYYIISDTGWLKLDSPQTSIIVDSKKIISKDINSYLKRSEIRDIIHTENGEIRIVTYKGGK